MRLSVIIIALNEAASIGAVLDSVAFADEIVVLDSNSSDDTAAICRARGARVEQAPDWPGFGAQKNRVLALARGEWVLSIDADEVVSAALAAEIASVLGERGSEVAWRIPRASSYCGRVLLNGGWWPDHVLRLFRREGARFSDDRVHERLLPPPGRIGTLVHPLEHATYATLDEVLHKVNRYSSEGAAQAYAEGRRASFASAIGHGCWAFLRTYLLRTAFLDGPHGFMLAVSNAEATYYRYAKLWLLGRTGKPPRRT
jgi:glycosyltransferase involved in cell wall biosynthesis